MSQIQVDNIYNKEGTGSPNFPLGANVTGVVTATSFSGSGANLTGIDATALKDSNGTVRVQANTTGAVITGNVSVGGTLTYEDVNSIDSIGIITARDDINIVTDNKKLNIGAGADLQLYHDGSHSNVQNSTGNLHLRSTANCYIQLGDGSGGWENALRSYPGGAVELYYNDTKRFETTNHGAITTGIHTVTVGTDLDGYKVEEGNSDTSTALNGEFDFELENGHVQRYSTATGGNYFPDFRVSSSQSLDSVMDIGDVISVTLMVASSSHYCTTGIKIDDSTSNLDIDWIGGAAPSAANGSGYDIYAFTIQKTGAAPAYHIIGNTLGAA